MAPSEAYQVCWNDRFVYLQEDDTAALKTTKSALGLHKLESFAVEHCSNAYGLLLEAEAGWKVVFSGDTRPCSSVVRAAENATVLIHEVKRFAQYKTLVLISTVAEPSEMPQYKGD